MHGSGAGETAVFRKEGEYWTIAHGQRVSRLRDTKGLVYIAYLLRYPRVEFHVLDLVQRAAHPEAVRAQAVLPDREEELATAGIHIGNLGDAGEVLDGQARSAYRRRLTELREQLEETKQFNHFERAAEIEREIDALVAELSRAVGLGGRSRRSASAAERARQSMTHAIKTAVEKIGENLPTLGQMLLRDIRTGLYCSYEPADAKVISWDLGIALAAPKEEREPTREATKDAVPIGDSALIGPPVSQFLSGQTEFVGRDAESQALRNLVDRALAGNGAVIMLGGGPGVGKTRLATETAAYAMSKGFGAFIGHCYERDEPYPYLPFVEIVEAMLAQSGAERFGASMGDNAAELAQIAPRLRRVFPDIPPPQELPTQQARRYLTQSLGEYLARTANARPLFLVLDDLHWSAESTLALVNFLAHRVDQLPMVIVGTYRDGLIDHAPALTRTLEELIRIGVRPLALRGLSREEVERMLCMLSLREPPESLVQLIFSETEGNPFFVEEVYKHLAEEGKVFDDAGNFRTDFQIEEIDVPASVRLVLGRRVERLSPASQRILSAVAAIGPGFSFKLAQALPELNDGDELLSAIEEAQKMGLIVSASNTLEASFAFAHELVRQTLLAGISQPRRQRLHLNAADAVVRLYPQDTSVRAAEIADHLIQAGSLADQQMLVHYLGAAGNNALEAAAYDEACRHFAGALSSQGCSPRQRADLTLGMATALRGLGNWDEAFANWNSAVDLYSSLGDCEATGNVFFEMFEGLLWSGRERAAAEVAQRGLAGLQQDCPGRVHMLGAMGLINSVNGRAEQAHAAFSEAAEMAAALPDQKLAARVLSYWAVGDFYFLNLYGSLEHGRKAAAIGAATGAPWSRAIGLSRVQVALHHLGRVAQAVEVGTELEPLARKLGHFPALSFCIWTEAWTEFAKDPDFTRLEKRLAEDLELNRTAKILLLLPPALAQLSVVEFLRGNVSKALDYAEQARELTPFQVMIGLGAGALFRQMAYAGDRADALKLFDESRPKLPRTGEPNTIGSWAMLMLFVEGLHELGEYEMAAGFYPIVGELIDTGTICMGWIARFPQTIAGIAAAAARNWDAAEEHFANALRQAEELPHLLEAAEIRRFRAAMLIRRGASGDFTLAHRLLSEALDSYERFGMRRHAELARATLAALREGELKKRNRQRVGYAPR